MKIKTDSQCPGSCASLQAGPESELLVYRTAQLRELINKLIDMAGRGDYSQQLFIRCLRVLAKVPLAYGFQSLMAKRIDIAMQLCAQREFAAARLELRKLQGRD